MASHCLRTIGARPSAHPEKMRARQTPRRLIARAEGMPVLAHTALMMTAGGNCPVGNLHNICSPVRVLGIPRARIEDPFVAPVAPGAMGDHRQRMVRNPLPQGKWLPRRSRMMVSLGRQCRDERGEGCKGLTGHDS